MEQTKFNVRGERGFSLIELVFAIGIILVLTVGGAIGYGAVTDNARKAATQSAAKDVLTAAMVYDSDLPSNNTEVEDAATEWNNSRSKGKEQVTTESYLQSVAGDRCVVAKATHVKGYVSVRAAGDTGCDALNEDTKDGQPIGGGDGSENGSNPGGSENGTGEEFLDVNGDGYDDNTGLDKEGFDKDGYDKDGYDRDGVDRDGKDRDGNHVIQNPGGDSGTPDWDKNNDGKFDWTDNFGPGGPKTVTYKFSVGSEAIGVGFINAVAKEYVFTPTVDVKNNKPVYKTIYDDEGFTDHYRLFNENDKFDSTVYPRYGSAMVDYNENFIDERNGYKGKCSTKYDSCSINIKVLDKTHNLELCSLDFGSFGRDSMSLWSFKDCNKTITGHFANGATDKEISEFLPKPANLEIKATVYTHVGSAKMPRITVSGPLDYTVDDIGCSTSSNWWSGEGDFDDREIWDEDTGYCDGEAKYTRSLSSTAWIPNAQWEATW